MSRPHARRPTLLPSVRRIWRGPHRLQLGTDPGRAVMLDLTDPACAGVLDLLDGSRTEARLLREAQRRGVPNEAAVTLLTALRAAGFVVDAHTLRPTGTRDLGEPTRRRLEFETAAIGLRGPSAYGPATTPAARMRRRLNAQVLIVGASQLAVPIATALAGSGVLHLDPRVEGHAQVEDALPAGLLPTDDDRPRGQAAVEAVRRAVPEAAVGPLRRGQATFAVLVGFSAPAALTALAYRRMAHLAVSVRDGTVVVGPLVRPGQTPCLNCLDLHRMDRDPAWRIVAPQLHTDGFAAEPLTTTTALAGAAYAADQALTHIDGGTPETVGSTVEIRGPGESTRRRWTQHPRCDCGRRTRSPTTAPPATRT